ncbi:MAG: sterol desaturase family protein [Phycisphaera sp.]|nr:sterol desaturase family protein [Phycisphaera sp.]
MFGIDVPEAWIKPIVIAIVLAILWVLEGLAPMYVGRRRRLGHDVSNLALGIVNAAVVALIFATLIVGVTAWAADRGFGLMNLVDWPAWVEWVVVLLLFDLWMYTWHVINHKVPLFWRFHAVHHSDADLDASSAVRFHTVEIVLSTIVRLAVLPLLGMTAGQLAVYETILLPCILFHHSNIKLPAGLDRVLRMVIITPRMHWVHHSDWQPETDSNFGTTISWWDRLWRTFRLREDPTTITLGLKEWGERETFNLWGMVSQPFRRGRATGESYSSDRSSRSDEDDSAS